MSGEWLNARIQDSGHKAWWEPEETTSGRTFSPKANKTDHWQEMTRIWGRHFIHQHQCTVRERKKRVHAENTLSTFEGGFRQTDNATPASELTPYASTCTHGNPESDRTQTDGHPLDRLPSQNTTPDFLAVSSLASVARIPGCRSTTNQKEMDRPFDFVTLEGGALLKRHPSVIMRFGDHEFWNASQKSREIEEPFQIYILSGRNLRFKNHHEVP